MQFDNKKPSAYKTCSGSVRTLGMVRMTGLEPARRGHQLLRLARLPIPPHPHMVYSLTQWLLYIIFRCLSTIKNKFGKLICLFLNKQINLLWQKNKFAVICIHKLKRINQKLCILLKMQHLSRKSPVFYWHTLFFVIG